MLALVHLNTHLLRVSTMAKSDASEKAKGKSPSVEHDDDIMAPSDAPPEIDPYAVLELATTASADDVKRAYRKKAIVHHPGESRPRSHRQGQ